MTSEKGQAMTEYVMISALITAIAIAFLNYMQTPLRKGMQCVTEYVIGQALNPPFSGAGGFGGLMSALNCGTSGGLGGFGGGGSLPDASGLARLQLPQQQALQLARTDAGTPANPTYPKGSRGH